MVTNINYRAEKIHHKVHRHLKHHVHRLREKPERHRKAVAFGIAAAVTLIVFMLWYFLSLPKILEAYRVDRAEVQRTGDDSLDKLKNAFDTKGNEESANIELNTTSY